MSSNEDEYNDGDGSSSLLSGMKKRRIQRACDICRRKKIRCDGVQMPSNRCSNCISYNYDCTYMEAAKKRGPPKGYVESLETRLEKLEKLLRRLCPDDKFLKELNENIDNDNWVPDRVPPFQPSLLVATSSSSGLSPSCVGHHHPCDMATSAIRRVGSNDTQDDLFSDDDSAHLILADNLKRLSIDPADYRFFGKSSGAMLIQTAIELKNEYTGSDHDLRRGVLGSKRPEFWTIRPWERESHAPQPAKYVFPEDDLIADLTDIYFEHVNLFLPLLHRPTFQKSVAEGLHHTNDMFGSTLLLVCAVASRYSNDPRVLLDGVDSSHSCGWKWFDQVQMVKKSLLAPPSLYDLQFYCLSVQFLQGSSAPQSCWTMVGIGIRLAQDVGAHRRKVNDRAQPTKEDEMWKRAFWVLICMDRMVSAALGRPCAIQDEDFDLDLPIECDDEYWDNPDPQLRFKQPPNKPSLVTHFVLYLKLNQVLAFMLRTIYSINKSKILLGFVGQQWEQHIVAELDSALNKWVSSVPDHLRWDPTREDDRFFHQSATLYAAYYNIQILIHRPFIPSPKKPSPLSFPSLAICTNAARSCSHVVDIQRRRYSMAPPQIQMAVFTSGIVLLLSIWGGKRSGLSTDPHKEMADVHKCMEVLRACEGRWHSAGRLWDILYELASVGELPLPQSSPSATNKRERDAESPISAPSSEASYATVSTDAPRSIAGSRRVTVGSFVKSQHRQPPSPVPSAVQSQSQTTQSLGTHTQLPAELAPPPLPPQLGQQLFTLPVYSDELGRLPLHGQVQFSAQGQSSVDANYWLQPISNGSSVPLPPPTDIARMNNQNQLTNNGFGEIGSMGYPMDQSGIVYDMGLGLPYPSVETMTFRDGNVQNIQNSNSNDQQIRYLHPQQQQTFVDNDTIAMWSTAPTGFELDEWGTYLSNVSELTQGHNAGAGLVGHNPLDLMGQH